MSAQREIRFDMETDHKEHFFSTEGVVNSIPSDGFKERLVSMFDFFPLYELKQKTSLLDYRGFELGVCLLLFVLEKMLSHRHCTYEDCEDFICRLLPMMTEKKTEQDEREQVARKLLDEITNRGSPFVYSFYNPFDGEEQQVKFRLIEQRPLSLYGQDTVALRLTEKGLEMLFKSREIYRELHFSVMQLYLDQQIRRGIFDGALKTVNELEVAVEGIEEECKRQREHVRRNVIESLNSTDYMKLLTRMDEQLQREQDIFDNLKELVLETRQRLENEPPGQGREGRSEKVFKLSKALHHVAARHLDLISSRADLENLVGQVLQESIYYGFMVRFHLKKEFLDTVLKFNPPGEKLKKTALFPLLRPRAPHVLGLEAFLAPQRLMGRERERPLEGEKDEPNLEAWEKYQQADKERKEQITALLQNFFEGILEVLTDKEEVTISELVEKLALYDFDKADVVAFAHLMVLLHQGRNIQASLPWTYEPGDEDLVEYSFYRLLKKRPELAGIGWVKVVAGEGAVQLPYDIEIKNLVLRRREGNGLQPEDNRNFPGTVEGTYR